MKKIITPFIFFYLVINTIIANPLHDAVEAGDFETAKSLIEKEVDINTKGKLGETPLHWAAFWTNLDAVKLLIEKGADINGITNKKETPLHWASISGDVAIAMLLIEKGSDINAKDHKGATPLLAASLTGKLEIVKLLIQKGAFVNEKTNDKGWTSLHYASRYGHIETVKYLLNKGANKELKTSDGYTPLDFAKEKEHTEIISILTNWKTKNNKSPLYDSSNDNYSSSKDNNDSPLHDAALEGNLDTVKKLIANGLDLNAKNKFGNTPLHYASIAGHLKIVKYLLSNGANNIKSNSGKTPLDFAREKEYVEIVSTLTNWGAMNNTDKNNYYNNKEVKIKESMKVADVVKIENNLATGWSVYQGAMNWNVAKAKCASIGMRLPTRDELVAAQKAGAWEKWQKEKEVTYKYSWYWTSEEYSIQLAYTVNMNTIHMKKDRTYVSLKDFSHSSVRCLP